MRAAEWVVRLGAGPLDADERRSLEAWLSRSRAHERAFQDAQRTWQELGQIAPHASRVAPDDRLGSGNRRRDAATRQRRGWRRVRRRSLAAALACVAGAFAFYYFGDPITALHADHYTAPGEVRTVTLPDGSTAELNSRTAIAVAFDGAQRRIELLTGDAVFTVTASADAGDLPFVVAAAGGEAEALGTRFLVSAEDEAVEVAVLEHSVAVTPTGGPDTGAAPLVLTVGQAVRFAPGLGLGPVRTVDPSRAAAWRRGLLVFDQVPLSEAVAELNRHRRNRIVVLDAALAARRVSGVFRLDDLDAAVDVIAAELGARTASLPPFATALF